MGCDLSYDIYSGRLGECGRPGSEGGSRQDGVEVGEHVFYKAAGGKAK
jgi:hypothetical protein